MICQKLESKGEFTHIFFISFARNFVFFFLYICFCEIIEKYIFLFFKFYTNNLYIFLNLRYCLICQVFKPERTHHCKTCKRCVLVMNHHCPWMSNCVGFKNRKTFMLFIIYDFIVGVFGILGSIYPLVLLGGEMKAGNYSRKWKFVIGIIGDILGCVLVGVMVKFLTYHFHLVNNNMVNHFC